MGAQGYLLKNSPPDQLLQAIQEIHQGKSSLHPDIARKVLREIRHPPRFHPQSSHSPSARSRCSS